MCFEESVNINEMADEMSSSGGRRSSCFGLGRAANSDGVILFFYLAVVCGGAICYFTLTYVDKKTHAPPGADM